MKKDKSLSDLIKTNKDINKWHKSCKPAERTIDNLLIYLKNKNDKLLFDSSNIAEILNKEKFLIAYFERKNIQSLASYLAHKKMDFVLTPTLVNAIVHPGIMSNPEPLDELTEGSYDFFIRNYHEHPLLETPIRLSLYSSIRLRILPVIPADSYLTNWLYDPFEKICYKFNINSNEKPFQIEKDKKRTIKSVGIHSILEEYNGKDIPFSKRYLEQITACKDEIKKIKEQNNHST